MFDDQDRAYYAKRAIASRALAEESKDPAIQKIHLDMAEEYQRRAQGLEPRQIFSSGGPR